MSESEDRDDAVFDLYVRTMLAQAAETYASRVEDIERRLKMILSSDTHGEQPGAAAVDS